MIGGVASIVIVVGAIYLVVSAYRLGHSTGQLKGQIRALQLLDRAEAIFKDAPVKPVATGGEG